MAIGKRGWLGVCGAVVASAGLMAAGNHIDAAGGRTQSTSAASESAVAGQLTETDLGNMIRAMGIEVSLEQKRYDFAFKTIYNKEEWNLSMSAVLSENGQSIWVMAWLDQCPKSAADVPRTALLRLLAKNDGLGNGKFFAYIPANNRFVLQRVVSNEDMTTGKFRETLQDLGASVVETYPHWSVANWKQTDQGGSADNMPQNNAKSAPSQPATETRRSGGRQIGTGPAPGTRSRN